MDALRAIRDWFNPGIPVFPPAEARASIENPSTNLSNADEWFYEALGATKGASGVMVSEQTAMRVTTVFACVQILADTVASLPAIVYQRTKDGGKMRAPEHPAYHLIHDEPNKYQTSFVWREMLQGHVSTYGNAYAIIERNNSGDVTALWPLTPRMIEPYLVRGELWYRVTDKGTEDIGIPPGVYRPRDVLHIPGLGFDGICGYSPIQMAREALGLAIAAENHGATFFGNGARPGGVLSTDQNLHRTQRQEMGDEWSRVHQGPYRSHKVAILSGGLKYHQIGLSNEDAQFLETRRFQVEEIARIFRIPLHMIQHTEKATTWGSGIEQMSIGFVTHTIRPWLVRWEQELNRKLLTRAERAEYFVEFNVDALLRGDLKSRFDAYAVAVNSNKPWMSKNEIRRLENLNPVEDGDDLADPTNNNAPAPAPQEV